MNYLTLKHRNPVFRGELDRLFEDFWTLPATREAAWTPAADIEELEDSYRVTLEVPGMKKEELHIEVAENQVLVSGERKAEEKPGLYSERRFGRFERAFALPSHVDAAKIEARYENGVLSIRVPKAETAKPRQITIL